MGDNVAINGRWQPAATDGGRWGKQWKTMVVSNDKLWQTGWVAAVDGGRYWWTMWLLAASDGSRRLQVVATGDCGKLGQAVENGGG